MTEHEQMIADCEKRESKLTDRERTFIDSIAKQIEDRALTPKQVQWLEDIWERIT